MAGREQTPLINKTGRSVAKGCSGVLLGLLGIALSAILVYFGLIGIGAILIVSDPVESVDAVVVLSGDDGDRLALAIEMHKMGSAPNLVITNTDRTANRLLSRQAEAGGFSKSDIYITELEVESTVDEAVAVQSLAQQQGWRSLMVVTDPYHSFRARLIFRRAFRSSGIQIYVRPVAGHWFRSPSWFFHPEGWQFVFLEISKIISYLLLGL